jgi:O-antigen/teichoic acid export membrane protein
MAAAAVLCLAVEGPGIVARARGGRADTDRAKAYAAYGLPIAGAIVLDLALSTADRFLIAAFLGEAATGAYAAGYQLGNRPIEILMLWAVTASSPLLMAAWERGGAEAVRAIARQTFTAMIAIGAPAAVGIALVAKPFAELLVGPELRADAALIAPWTAASALMSGLMIHYFSESFQLVRRTDLRALMVAIPAIANIGLNLVLIPQFGLMGAVASTVAAYALGVVVMAVAGRRFIALPVDPGVVLKTAAACAAMAGAVMLLPSPGGVLELAAKAIVGAGVYGVVALALDLGGVRSQLRARFRPVRPA